MSTWILNRVQDDSILLSTVIRASERESPRDHSQRLAWGDPVFQPHTNDVKKDMILISSTVAGSSIHISVLTGVGLDGMTTKEIFVIRFTLFLPNNTAFPFCESNVRQKDL
jgi:hypothetical protein